MPALMIARRLGGALLCVPSGYISSMDFKRASESYVLGPSVKCHVSMRVGDCNREASDQVLAVIVFDLLESSFADRLGFYNDSDVEFGAFPIANIGAFGEAEGWPFGPELVDFATLRTDRLRAADGGPPARAATYFSADEEARRSSDVAAIPSALAGCRPSSLRRPLAHTSLEIAAPEES